MRRMNKSQAPVLGGRSWTSTTGYGFLSCAGLSAWLPGHWCSVKNGGGSMQVVPGELSIITGDGRFPSTMKVNLRSSVTTWSGFATCVMIEACQIIV